MKTMLLMTCFWVLAAPLSAQCPDDVIRYVIKYKGIRCIKNKAGKKGSDLKIYFLCIPEKTRPNQIATLPIDSIDYQGIKKDGIYESPVLKLFEGTNQEGVSLICNLVESKAQYNHSINLLEATLSDFKVAIHSEKGALASDSVQTTTDSSEFATTTKPESNSKWLTQIKIDHLFNPFAMIGRLIRKKDQSIEKKYFLLKASEIQLYLNKTPEKAFDIEHHFKLVLRSGDAAYEVYFEIVPK